MLSLLCDTIVVTDNEQNSDYKEAQNEAPELFQLYDDDSHLLNSNLSQQVTKRSPQSNPSLSDILNSPAQEHLNDSLILFESPTKHRSDTTDAMTQLSPNNINLRTKLQWKEATLPGV